MLTDIEIKDAIKKIDKGGKVCFFKISDLRQAPREEAVYKCTATHYSYGGDGRVVFQGSCVFPRIYYNTKALFYTEEGAVYAYIMQEIKKSAFRRPKKMSACVKSMEDQTLVRKDKVAIPEPVKNKVAIPEPVKNKSKAGQGDYYGWRQPWYLWVLLGAGIIGILQGVVFQLIK